MSHSASRASARGLAITVLVGVFLRPAAAQSCGLSWCKTFPVGTAKATPPFGSSAWNKLVYIPDDRRFFIYTSDGIYTFSNSWWSYGVLGHPATDNPWQEETTSGTTQTTVTDNSKGFLFAAVGPRDHTIMLRPGNGTSFHPDPLRGGILIIDDEEIGYSLTARAGDTLTDVVRGIRGTVPASHDSGALVNAGAPNPQSRIHDKLIAVADHLPDRHPFLTAAYDSRRHRLVQAGGIIENNKKNDTWYLCTAVNSFCPAEDFRIWKRMFTHTPIPARADSAMAYDSDDDVMIVYGGQNVGNPTDDTWLLCFHGDPQISGNVVGCPQSGTYPDWVRVSSTNGSPGPRFAHALVYDSFHHVALLFGGANGTRVDPDETLLYTPSTREWNNAKPSGHNPVAFRRPAMTYDSTLKRVVLYEGPRQDTRAAMSGGLYIYDAAANNWQWCAVRGGPIPSSSDGTRAHGRISLGYDPQSDTFVASELGSGYSLETWELKGEALESKNPSHVCH